MGDTTVSLSAPGLFWSPIHQFLGMFLFRLLFPCLLVGQSQGESCTEEVGHLKDIMDNMRVEIYEIKDNMKIKEEQVIAEIYKKIKDDLETDKEQTERKVDEVLKKIEALRTDNQALRMKLEKRDADMKSLETSVAEVRKTRGLPYVMTCSYQDAWSTSLATITYDSLISDYKNSDDPNGGDGVMDLATGVYTVIKPSGYYTVTFSGSVVMEPGQYARLYLYHNGTGVPETQWWSYNSPSNGGDTYDQGSRTVTLHLDREDTLEIRADYIDAGIYDFVFCLSLKAGDYTPPY